MKRLTFTAKRELDTALLIKQNSVFDNNKQAFGQNYFIPIGAHINEKVASRVVVVGTYHPDTGKIKKKDLVVFAEEILEYCDTMGITNLLVADSEYFKYLTGMRALEKHIGEKFECIIHGFGDLTIVPMINYGVISSTPEKKPLLDKANKVAAAVMNGTYSERVEFEFESYEFIDNAEELEDKYESYAEHEYLACDIEATGLYVGPTELLTIAFAKDEYNAFTVPLHDMYDIDPELRAITKEFFKNYEGKLIFHNGLFDAKHIIYALFMDDFNDIDGMLEGIEALGFEDTFIMAYLELNSTVRPTLGLKDLAYDFLGDYAENVKDAASVPLDKLAVYNAKDVCGTFYVFNKYKHILELEIYKTIMRPSLKPLLKMMLNGMPLDLTKVSEVKTLLQDDLGVAEAALKSNAYVQLAERQLRLTASEKYNASHKTITKGPGDFMDLKFNPNSSAQLRLLLFDIMGFEPIDYTPTKNGKTDRASIQEFATYAEVEQKPVLDALVTISQAGIVLNTFINAFEELSITQDGGTTLHGSLVLGGTQSGRLSSRDPNMQNLPSNSKWGKAIKSCFRAPEGWLFAGADFNALEDRIGAILSKDPVKLKENLGGFDGHCLRAHAFFPEELAEKGLDDIDGEDPDSINRIKDEAPEIRQDAKPVSFLKQYGGGASKIQQTLKCTKARSQEISDAYDTLYKVTLQFNARNADKARALGYAECAFGLKLKTPRINARENGVKSSEERSSNNAVTQSWGMLMNRAFIEFDERVEEAGLSHSIKMINTIHDATYLLIKEDLEVIQWVNKNLIECMEWQDDPLLESEIKLGAELDIGKSWDKQYTLKNDCPIEDIVSILGEINES